MKRKGQRTSKPVPAKTRNVACSIPIAMNFWVIGNYLARFLNLRELKDCTLVSTEWNKVFRTVIRKRSLISLANQNQMERLIKHVDTHLSGPHKEFKLRFFRLTPLYFPSRLQTQFWTLHGATMTFLRIEHSRCCTLQTLLNILFRRTPNLKTLIFRQAPIFNYENYLDFKNSEFLKALDGQKQLNLTRLELIRFSGPEPDAKVLAKLLLVYPNLKHLTIGTHFPSLATMYSKLVPVFGELLKARQDNPTSYQLEALQLVSMHDVSHSQCHDGLSQEFTDALNALNFPLKTLTLEMGNESDAPRFASILERFKNTLENLDVGHFGKIFDHLTWSPCLSFCLNLKVLRIHGDLCSNMNFLQHLPNLQILHVIAAWSHVHPSQLLFPGVQNCRWGGTILPPRALAKLLDFRWDFKWLPSPLGNMIGEWMPNLDILILNADHNERLDSVLREVLDQFQNLKELTIRIGEEESVARLLNAFPRLQSLQRKELIQEEYQLNLLKEGVPGRLPFTNLTARHLI